MSLVYFAGSLAGVGPLAASYFMDSSDPFSLESPAFAGLTGSNSHFVLAGNPGMGKGPARCLQAMTTSLSSSVGPRVYKITRESYQSGSCSGNSSIRNAQRASQPSGMPAVF